MEEQLREELKALREEVETLREWRTQFEAAVKNFATGTKANQAEVTEVVGEVIDRLHAVEAATAAAPSPSAAPGDDHLPWSLRATEDDWRRLSDWLDWLGRHYAPQLHLRIWPCWPLHGGVTEELAALHASWRAATEADADPSREGSDLAYWHQMWLWPTIERIRQHYMFSECEDDHSQDRPGRPTDGAALRKRMTEAEAERRRRENEKYAYYVKTGPDHPAERPSSLWRCAAGSGSGSGGGGDWEYLSLLDWQWHKAAETVVQDPPPEAARHRVTADRAGELQADRQGWVRYWARYADEPAWRAGEPPVSVVRRRRSPERIYDEAYKTWNEWGPTQTVHDFFDARPSNPPHLVEIDAAKAERLLTELHGAKGATEL
ncbi:hypothetical protein [Streptomyces telluris]|uniref:Uncharacterized protein n=1 Tax=Streptomyces telluris TaxID=2720021 RepID=A0A9X2LMM0_9ACTN|nr:hypothetical protein [Streptomyces telluris]MCQ8773754.1 hypothetical protein [Streptomyces telluris]NJP77073.1 hypothetical protein [Streptomyces telluris]